MNEEQLTKDIAEVLNKHGVENGSNTPDFVLAEYLVSHLKTFGFAIKRREESVCHCRQGHRYSCNYCGESLVEPDSSRSHDATMASPKTIRELQAEGRSIRPDDVLCDPVIVDEISSKLLSQETLDKQQMKSVLLPYGRTSSVQQRPGISDETIKKAFELRSRFKTVREIADILGVDRDELRQAMADSQNNGIKRKTGDE